MQRKRLSIWLMYSSSAICKVGCFCFIQDEGADLPLTPRWLEKEKKFPVPDGIRPILVKTGVEVLYVCYNYDVLFEIYNQSLVIAVVKNDSNVSGTLK